MIAVAAIVVLFVIVRSFGAARGKADETAKLIATVQAERDTLRANHAVAISRLEHKLNEARAKHNENLNAVLAAKGADRRIAALTETTEDLKEQLDEALKKNAGLLSEVEKLSRDGADLSRLKAERDTNQKVADGQSQTISELRRDLQDAVRRASIATSAKADLSDEIETLKAERDRLNAEIDRQSGTISTLKTELQEAVAQASRASGVSGEMADVAEERDKAQRESEQHAEKVNVLRNEVQQLAARLAEANSELAAARELAEEAKTLRASEEHLKRVVRERELTVHELRTALARGETEGGPASAEAEGLRRSLADAEKREQAAVNRATAAASERDGLKRRLAQAEQAAETARIAVETNEALLELRTQKLEQLEDSAQRQLTQLSEMRRRAEAAEAQLAAEPGGENLVDANATVAHVQAELDALRAENETMRADAQARERAEDPGELRAALDKLARENAALRNQRPGPLLGEGDVTALKDQLNRLADRFLEKTETAVSNEAALSLAERIRAFKAARAAGIEPGRR